MIIKVRILNGATEEMEVNSSITIKDLKVLIHEQFGVLPQRQRLVFQGRLLSDDSTVESCNIREGSTIFCVENEVTSTPSTSTTTTPTRASSSTTYTRTPGFATTHTSLGDGVQILTSISLDENINDLDLQSILEGVFGSISARQSDRSPADTSTSSSTIQSTSQPSTARISNRFTSPQLGAIQRRILDTEQLFHELRNNISQNYSINTEQRTILLFLLQNLTRTIMYSTQPLRIFGTNIHNTSTDMRRYAQEIILSLRKISYYIRLCSNILENEVGQQYSNMIPIQLSMPLQSLSRQNFPTEVSRPSQVSTQFPLPPTITTQIQSQTQSTVNPISSTFEPIFHSIAIPIPQVRQNTSTIPSSISHSPIQLPQNIYTSILNAVAPQVLPVVQNTINSVTDAFRQGFGSNIPNSNTVNTNIQNPNIITPDAPLVSTISSTVYSSPSSSTPINTSQTNSTTNIFDLD